MTWLIMKTRLCLFTITLIGLLFVGCIKDDPTPNSNDTVVVTDTTTVVIDTSSAGWDTVQPISIPDSVNTLIDGLFCKQVSWQAPDTLWVIRNQQTLDSLVSVYSDDNTTISFDFTSALIILCRVTYPDTSYELTDYYLVSNGTSCKFHATVMKVYVSGYQVVRSQLFWVAYPNICADVDFSVY